MSKTYTLILWLFPILTLDIDASSSNDNNFLKSQLPNRAQRFKGRKAQQNNTSHLKALNKKKKQCFTVDQIERDDEIILKMTEKEIDKFFQSTFRDPMDKAIDRLDKINTSNKEEKQEKKESNGITSNAQKKELNRKNAQNQSNTLHEVSITQPSISEHTSIPSSNNANNFLKSQLPNRAQQFKNHKAQQNNTNHLKVWKPKKAKDRTRTIRQIENERTIDRILQIAKPELDKACQSIRNRLDESIEQLDKLNEKPAKPIPSLKASNKKKKKEGAIDSHQAFLFECANREIKIRAQANKKYEEQEKEQKRKELEKKNAQKKQNQSGPLHQVSTTQPSTLIPFSTDYTEVTYTEPDLLIKSDSDDDNIEATYPESDSLIMSDSDLDEPKGKNEKNIKAIKQDLLKELIVTVDLKTKLKESEKRLKERQKANKAKQKNLKKRQEKIAAKNNHSHLPPYNSSLHDPPLVHAPLVDEDTDFEYMGTSSFTMQNFNSIPYVSTLLAAGAFAIDYFSDFIEDFKVESKK